MLVLKGIDLDPLAPQVVMIENIASVSESEDARSAMDKAEYELIAGIRAADDVFKRRETNC